MSKLKVKGQRSDVKDQNCTVRSEINLIIILLIMVLIIYLINCSGSGKVFSENTINENRIKFKNDLIEKINSTIKKELNSETVKEWEEIFWAINFIRYKNDDVKNCFKKIFENIDSYSISFQRAFLESVYAIFEDEFVAQCWEVIKTTDNDKIFAMASLYIARADNNIETKNKIVQLIINNFSNYKENPILYMLLNDFLVTRQKEIKCRPDMVDLLKHNFYNKPVIFSFQRMNRNYEGIAIIRKPDGTFLLSEGDNLFFIPQLALSLSNLPGYITNGNTPQGIFSFQEIYNSENIFIGPTEALLLTLPYEVSVSEFFHNKEFTDEEWSIEKYNTLLPTSWYGYHPFYEAYYAGKAGRNEILAHGTTIDSEYYRDEIYYPNTPSLGCLTAREIWDDDGGLLSSEQVKIIDALKRNNIKNGYFIVVEIDDKEKPVTIDEIEVLIILNEIL
ncbi:MAG: hypothetical protein JW866_00585 [Ignavibacteriales bacterium]|nr:hypothetical protein [Ignavibacteriales bacterium]